MVLRNSIPWVWVYCTDYRCGHSRAVALTPWAIRWGVDDPAELIRKHFRCVICGRRGATLRLGGVQHDSKSYDHFPIERPVGIGGERRTGESYQSQEARCAAIYASKREAWSRFWPC